MDFNTLSAQEKLDKYMAFNAETPLSEDSFVSYIPAGDEQEKNLESVPSYASFNIPNLSKSSLLNSLSYTAPKPSGEIGVEPTELDPDLAKKIDKHNKQVGAPSFIKPLSVKGLDFNKFEERIRIKESENNPRAANPKSSAVGYYQFLWKSWGDSIKKVTGVKDVEDFKNNPSAQKEYFKFYFNNQILPGVDRVKKAIGKALPLDDFDLAQLIHFQGEKGAIDTIKTGTLNEKKQSYNPSAIDYIRR